MVLGLVLSADKDDKAEPRQFDNLADYQAAVGGWIEPIEIPSLRICLFVNEEGRLRDLPINPRATFLWWFHVLEARQSATMVGDVVIVGMVRRGGVPKDVPEQLVAMFAESSRFAVEYRPVKSADWRRYPGAHTYADAAVWAMLIADKAPIPLEIRIISSTP